MGVLEFWGSGVQLASCRSMNFDVDRPRSSQGQNLENAPSFFHDCLAVHRRFHAKSDIEICSEIHMTHDEDDEDGCDDCNENDGVNFNRDDENSDDDDDNNDDSDDEHDEYDDDNNDDDDDDDNDNNDKLMMMMMIIMMMMMMMMMMVTKMRTKIMTLIIAIEVESITKIMM